MIFKRIPPFQDTFESKINIFKEKCVPRYSLDRNCILEIQDIKDIIVQHKKSPVEFKRGNKFIICYDNYKIKAISELDIKKYINKAKVFIDIIDNIVSQDEGLFRSD